MPTTDQTTDDPSRLPPSLPVPQDDGACDHLTQPPLCHLPGAIALQATDGEVVTVSTLGSEVPTVVFAYPRTGIPGQPPNLGFHGEQWEDIPGARGCTPQSCGFRDAFSEFAALGVRVFGLSTNTSAHQREFKARQHVPFEFLSDSDLLLTRAMCLPTFEFPVESGGPTTLLKRFAMLIEPDGDGRGVIRKVWYPVFPPNQNAATVLAWLRSRAERATKIASARPRVAVRLRAASPVDLPWIQSELHRNWHSTRISSRGVWFDADQLPAMIAETPVAEPVGLITYTHPAGEGECEVVTLSARTEEAGVGSKLLDTCAAAARAAGCRRIFLTTTNDNLRAIRFYQRRGWRLAAVHRDAMTIARRTNPSIPEMGLNGIPLRDELEFELRFDGL